MTKPVSPEVSALIVGREIKFVGLESIVLDPANARRHGPDSIRVIKDSLVMFGQTEPVGIQASTRKVIWGNGRVQAMRELGWPSCAAVELSVDNTTAAALSLALNRTAERSEWDYELVASHIRRLEDVQFDVALLGWDAEELSRMLTDEWTPPALGDMPTSEPEPSDDAPHALLFTHSQWELVKRGIAQVRKSETDETIPERRAVEGIVNAYLGGP